MKIKVVAIKPFSTSESNSNSGVNYVGSPKFNFPNIELNNFDDTTRYLPR
jgi:hypothetical protein